MGCKWTSTVGLPLNLCAPVHSSSFFWLKLGTGAQVELQPSSDSYGSIFQNEDLDPLGGL